MAHLDDVTIGEEALRLDPLAVDVSAVQAAIDQQESLRRPEYVRVASRNVLPMHRDIG